MDAEDLTDWTGVGLGIAFVVLGFTGFLVTVFGQPTPEERAVQQGYQDAINKQAYDEGYKSGLKYLKDKGGRVD